MSEYIKSTASLIKFKKIIKTWPGPKYKCSVCKWEWNFLLNIMNNILQRWIQSAVKHQVELYVKTVNDLKSLKAVIAKSSTLGIWWGSEYTSAFPKLYIWTGGEFSQYIRCIKMVLDFWFIFFYFFNISLKYCFSSFLYLICYKLFEAFNPRINKAIIIILQ